MKTANKIAHESSFGTQESFSPEDVLAAGGTTAFGLKTGKTNASLINALKTLPKEDLFTEEEWNDLFEQLKKNK